MNETRSSQGATPITLRVRGQDYTGWLQCEVETSLEAIAGIFSVPITWDYRTAPPVSRQDEVQVLIGRTVLITGYILGAEPFYKRDDVGLRIVGRDRTGDLVKCSALHKGGQWRNVKLDRIAQDLVEPYGIELAIDTDIGAPIQDFKLQHGEPLLDALSRAARLRGVLVTRNAKGQLALTMAGKAKARGMIVGGYLYAKDHGGGNVIEMQGQGTDENRFSVYTSFGQSHAKSQADFETARQLKARTTDPEIKRYLPQVINADGNVTQADLQALVDHTARVRRGQAYAYRYKLEGWTHDNSTAGEPWTVNTRVVVWDDIMGSNGEEWLITSAKFSHDLKEGCVTDLVIKPVAAYERVPLKSKQKKGWSGGKTGRSAK